MTKTNNPIKLAISGAAGRMGMALIRAATETTNVEVSAAFEHSNHPRIGNDIGDIANCGNLGVALRADDDESAFASPFDLLIEFTTPQVTLAHLATCQRLAPRHGHRHHWY